MGKKLLPKSFFRKNQLASFSTALVAYFSMTCLEYDTQNTLANELIQIVPVARQEDIQREKDEIDRLDSGEAVIRFMRRGCNTINYTVLSHKALSMSDEVFPLLLRRFRTSGQIEFIETAVCILARGEQAYIEQLKEMYPEIRNPYAQSLACLVFGMQMREDTLPLLLSEYERMKIEYPGESFCQGPLLAIYLICDEL